MDKNIRAGTVVKEGRNSALLRMAQQWVWALVSEGSQRVSEVEKIVYLRETLMAWCSVLSC